MRSHAALSMGLAVALLITTVLAALGAAQAPDHAGDAGNRSDDAGADRAPEGRPGPAQAAEDRQAARWAHMPEGVRERVLQKAAQARLFGHLGYDAENGTATGAFVSFRLDEAAGRVVDYTPRVNGTNVTFFADIVPSAWTSASEAQVHGAVLRHDGGNATLAAHSNPTAALRYHAGSEALEVRFHAAANATLTAKGDREVVVAKDGTHAHVLLTGNGTLTVESDVLIVNLEPGAGALVRAHPADAADTATLHTVNDAISRGRFGGSLAVLPANGTAAADAVLVDVALEPTRVEAGNVSVLANATVQDGRLVTVSVPADLLPENVTVLLDNRTVPAVAASAMVDATDAAAHVTRTADAVQVLVHIPSFSTHEVTIRTADTDSGTTDDGTTDTDTSTDSGDTSDPTTTDGDDTGTSPDAQDGDASGNGTPMPGLVAVLAALGFAGALRRRN